MLLLILWTGLVRDLPRAQLAAPKSHVMVEMRAPEPTMVQPTPSVEAPLLPQPSPHRHRTGQGRAVLQRHVARIPMIRVARPVVYGHVGARRIRQALQRSLRPRVQDCFARERAGDPHWSGRAVLVLTIEGPEISRADVETESEPLRQCILEGIDYLVFPSTDDGHNDRILVHYPFVSPAHPVRATAPLEEATDTLLNTVFREEASASPFALLASE